MGRTQRSETMSLDTYTQNIPLTQKARFWSNYVAALKGSQDLRAPDEAALRTWHPSIIETLPNEFPDLKHEFGKLESQMFDRPRRRGADPLSPSCLMQETESSAWVTTTAPSTPRSMAHTEQGLPVPARHQLPSGNTFDSESFRKISPPNTKVSNVPHTSFFVSLLMLSAASRPCTALDMILLLRIKTNICK